MIIIMEPEATEQQIQHVEEKLKQMGFGVHLSRGVERTVIGAIGDKSALKEGVLERLPGVSEIVHIRKPYKLVGREFQHDDTVVKAGTAVFGGNGVVSVIAGPCSVETRDQLMAAARAVKAAGARALRGGAFKPRTSPYSFQGLGVEGLKLLHEAKKETGLPVVSEIMDARDLPMFEQYVDVIQVGARNMQNFTLLKELGQSSKPVLLKRGLSATIDEWLLCAEYILAGGNRQVILCERGIRTMETHTRNTLDISAVPVVKKLSHLPILVDPSHGTGKWDLVGVMARAAVAAGADGLLIEVHPNPEEALCDGPQSLTLENFGLLMKDLNTVAAAVGRSV